MVRRGASRATPGDRLAAIVESADWAILATTIDGIVTHWNAAAERLFGYPAAEIVGRPVTALIPPDRLEAVMARGARVAEGERVTDAPTVALRRDGTPIDVSMIVSPILGPNGEVVGVSGIATDIGERVRVERALRASEERFRTSVENLPDAFAICSAIRDESGRITDFRVDYVNAAACAASHRRREDFVGARIREWSLDGRAPAWFEESREVVETGVPLVKEVVRYEDGPDGTPRVATAFDIRVAKLGDGTVASWRDVTDRREAHDALDHALERLQEADALKNALVRTVSHDLLNPLTVIRGNAQTLERRGDDLPPETRLDLLHRIGTSASRLARLVSDLLDIERLERETVEPARVPTDLAALVSGVVETLEPDDHPVQVDALPVVADVDPIQVERIVENLVANAVRHTPSGTPIWVRVLPEHDAVLLLVEDAGPGVPDDLRETIFEAFRKGDESRPGTGIGLSLVARFAELHGGRVWVEDRPGGGASFRVRLPVAPQAS